MILLSLSLLYLCFIWVHIWISGQVWFWNTASMIPPFLFVLFPLLFIPFALYRRKFIAGLFFLFGALLGFTQLDINYGGFWYQVNNADIKNEITVFNWNTGFWYEDGNTSAFYDFLLEQQADIYQLQEFQPGQDAISELSEYFPDYTIIEHGDVITMSKYETEATYRDPDGRFLEVDIVINTDTYTFLNVHLPIHLIPQNLLAPPLFFTEMQKRFDWRNKLMDDLEDRLQNQRHPFVLSGDFNTSSTMGTMGRFMHYGLDTAIASNDLFLTTWNNRKWYTFWRIDYMIVSDVLHILEHQYIINAKESDHSGILVRLGLPFRD